MKSLYSLKISIQTFEFSELFHLITYDALKGVKPSILNQSQLRERKAMTKRGFSETHFNFSEMLPKNYNNSGVHFCVKFIKIIIT